MKEEGVLRPDYKEVKNHLHNTLGITKEYVQELIKESVQDEIRKLLNSGYIHESVDKNVNYRVGTLYGRGFSSSFGDNVRGIIAKEVGRMLVEKMDINVVPSDSPKGVNFIYHVDKS